MADIAFISQLEEAGYFKYTEKKYSAQVKACISRYFIEEKDFMTDFNFDGPFQEDSLDLRFYNCGNCEELFEEGGVVSLIEKMQPLFEKIGITIKYSNDNYENYKHTIKVNKRTYLLAYDSPLSWGETFEKYAKMINNELAINKSDEMIFLYSHDSGAYMVFLTEQQNKIINSYLDKNKMPLSVDDWLAKMLKT